MPANRSNRVRWIERVKEVEREHAAARLAADRLLTDVRHDATLLDPFDLEPEDARTMAARLDSTYFVRLFTAFEAGLRDYWAATRATRSPARTRDLVDAVASRSKVRYDQLAAAHAAREQRNDFVHGAGTLATITVPVASRTLARFLSFVKPDW